MLSSSSSSWRRTLRPGTDETTICASLCQTQNHTHGCIMLFICLPQQVLLLLTDSSLECLVSCLFAWNEAETTQSLPLSLFVSNTSWRRCMKPKSSQCLKCESKRRQYFYCCITEAKKEEELEGNPSGEAATSTAPYSFTLILSSWFSHLWFSSSSSLRKRRRHQRMPRRKQNCPTRKESEYTFFIFSLWIYSFL